MFVFCRVEDEDDEDGRIQSSRNAFKTSRSSSAGKIRSYKRTVKYGGRNDDESDEEENAPNDFMTASKKLKVDSNPGGRRSASTSSTLDRGSRQFNPGKSVIDAINKTEGGNSAPKRKFTAPSRNNDKRSNNNNNNNNNDKKEYTDPIYEDERLAQIDPKHVEMILSEIMDSSAPVSWDDIAGNHLPFKFISTNCKRSGICQENNQ